jgi:2-C-methyl-D-erythritol 4-phosphate cytidylyltransferase
MVYAGILAGGMGERIGNTIPKQFLEVSGKPIIYWPLKQFHENKHIDKIIVSTRASHIHFVSSTINKYFDNTDKFVVIEGGKTRFHSMENILIHIKSHHEVEDNIILIHEAARPLINQRIIEDHVNALNYYDATNTLFPAVDTMMISNDGEFISAIPDKSKMYVGQTPQGYKLCHMLEIIENELTEDDIKNEVDFCAVYLRKDRKVKIITGDESLFKVTYEKDLALFKDALSQLPDGKT